MNICRFSVTRPVAAIVFMLLLILFGLISLSHLPIREYPSIEVPTISVTTEYTGASSSVMETKITQPIENAIAGIEGLETIQSTSKEGKSSITLEFSIDRDLDAAANDVRDRINRIVNALPDEADSPIVRKYDADSMPIMMIAVTSPYMAQMELSDYTDRYIVDNFSVIDGVAAVNIMGNCEQSMRIWLDRNEMASHGVTVADIQKALKEQNVEYPAGRIESTDQEYPITIDKQFESEEDFQRIVVAKDENDNPIRISDIARVTIEPKSQRNSFKTNRENLVTIGISKQSTANTLSIAKETRKLLENMKTRLPDGMQLRVIRDDSKFIEQSIGEVFSSMLMAALCVFLIVFVFIGSLKAALIPTITVPISIISSCIVMNMLGYSINMLTMLAMVLAVGIVVDDTILVLENIQRRIDEGEHPLLASVRGSHQVLFAVISTTVVLLAVFLPIGMLPGKTGKLFTEFSVAISSAVCFSSFVALVLTPMLCSKLLSKQKNNKFNILVDKYVEKSKAIYYRLLENLLNHKIAVSIGFLSITAVTFLIITNIPGEYEPQEDRNMFMVRANAQEGTGFYAMQNYADIVLNEMYPLLDNKMANNIICAVPGFGGSDGAVNSAVMMVDLVDHENRPLSVMEIIRDLRRKFSKIPGLRVSPVLPSGIGSRGMHPLQFVLGGYSYDELVKWRDIIFEEAKKYPGIMDIDCDYKETTPKLRISIDKERAGDLDVSTDVIGSTLEVMLGSKNVTTFIDRGQEYDVVLQADRRNRANLTDISNIYVKSQSNNQLIPLDNLLTIKEKGEATKLGRQNRSRSVTISGNIASGYTIGEVINFMEKVVREKLPEYAQIFYRGQSKDYKDSEGGILFVFVLAILVSYFVLAAQFESFVSPFIIMLSVPLGVFGAVSMLYLSGFTMNIYTQIGLIMLIGLSTKHGILIVEFANQLRDEGVEFRRALLEAAKTRLRPVMMTGISTVIGALPLLFAVGASSASRRNLGMVEVFGGISGVLLTLVVIPVGYILFNKNETSPEHIEKELQKISKNI